MNTLYLQKWKEKSFFLCFFYFRLLNATGSLKTPKGSAFSDPEAKITK